MTLRVWIIGALAALPVLVSGALAQTPASSTTSPAATTSPVPGPIRRPRLARLRALSARSCPCPRRRRWGLIPRQVLLRPPPRPLPRLRLSRLRSRPRPRPSRRKWRRLRRRAKPRSATILDRHFSPTPSSPPPRRPSAILAIVDAGGWPTDINAIGPGTKGAAVVKLRKRLAIEGDLDAKEASGPAWDKGLTAAVKRFQARMGLRQTGIVSGATLKAINVPAKVRFNQLASSANRLAGLNFSFEDRYVVVNLPSTSVEAIENGRVVHRYVAIVGDPEHPSPEISAHIQVVNLNPTWTVPTSIIKKEIIPRMQRDPSYLTRAKIRILDGSGKKEINPKSVNWSTEQRDELHASAGFGRGRIRSARSASRHAQ